MRKCKTLFLLSHFVLLLIAILSQLILAAAENFVAFRG